MCIWRYMLGLWLWSTYTSVFFLEAKYRNFFSKILILAIFCHFLIAKFFIQLDHFSSIWANFHQIMMIPSKIWTKVLHFLFHWCHTLDKWKFTEKNTTTAHSIVKSILNYQKKDSIESKVDRKPPFPMLIMTPYIVQINFFPNFYWILKSEHMNFTQLYTWNYTQLLWWGVAFIIDRAS
jgi:hypothetical protein